MKIEKIDSITFDNVYKVLTSNRISDAQKTQFIKQHQLEIKKVMAQNISSAEFKTLMENRVLQKFRPFKNSFTKSGDKMILAKALELTPSQIPQYIKNVTESLAEIDKLSFLSADKIELLKTYVYRHGTKDELVAFLDYELTKSKDLVKTLYTTLRYHNQGVADYFIRPIHRMDNNTLIKVYRTIDKHLKKAYENGDISEAQSEKVARWALVQIYKIQNNSKLINAIKTYKTLS
jgi:hypothetical protein